MNEGKLVETEGEDVLTASTSDTGPLSYTIGDLAKEFDVTLRTLRFYEDKNLLNPRREGMTRIYSRRDRARLKLVLMGKKVGFSLTEIKDMLDLYDLRDGQVTQLRVALGRFTEQIEVLQRQRDDVDRAIADLERTVAVVSGMLREKEKTAGSED
ncbi:MerR family transcriptional regulator [Cohaesibacter gelatinilyticus]|uniref:DNA-binding transcriptional regulator, MerR family n=1 Tax=Cohaesibacter gelatinilyticus TaxID=372072 RepID=A0A285N6B8_9HYPH|nr:DNA-binding transcriptional regulator, MerR family [Cohaesibacter gelatinilyticus]HAT87875.1 MerR family DNA-binding transcriptional regulator [Hyphomicrobiales bacterium]